MSDQNESLEEMLFQAALEKPSAEERAAFLDQACHDNPALRARLEVLLEGYFGAAGFLPDLPIERPPRDTVSEKPGDRIGRFKLREKIGEGGCGVVYVAEQEEPVRRKVALKIIKVGLDTQNVIARFEAERQALAMMDHPNIAKVYDAGATETGRPYFVMELVRGRKITDYCDQNQLSTRERLELFIKVCQAVQHAHQKGIIHRDLKPSNILVTFNDGAPAPKVIDFGIAKATSGKLTNHTVYTDLHQFIGTPAYMSPEQATMTSQDIDTRSDIYSLGVLFYELITGKTPFETQELLAAGMDELRRTIREQEPVRPSTRLSTMLAGELTTRARQRATEPPKLIHLLRGDLDWIALKCLEKDRTRRYETANGLAADLQRHMNNEPVVARPPSAAYRLEKAWRRHKITFAAATAVVLILVLGIAVSSWQAIAASRSRDAEREQRLAAQAAQQAEQQARLQADAEKTEADHLLYVANMNLAQQAWDQNNFIRLQQLLKDTQDSPYRGFEWYYWQRLAHLALTTLRGHLHYVVCVAFSRDGKRIASGSTEVKVWDLASGKELQTFYEKIQSIRSVAFSPDGQRIVTGSSDGTARVWDVLSGREVLKLYEGRDWISSAAFSPDGQKIVTGSSDGTARVWEAASGKELLTLNGHSGTINSVSFSADGRQIAIGNDDATAMVWGLASGRLLQMFKGHSGLVTSVAFSPDGQRIVTGSADATAKVWEVATGQELRTLKGHSDRIDSVAFSPDGQRIVTGSWDQTAKVWDAASEQELFSLRGHGNRIDSVAFSPDGQRIVTGSWDQTAKVWAADGSRERLKLNGQTGDFNSMVFSPDGQRIVTGGSNGLAKMWEVASGRLMRTFSGHSDSISSVAISPDGQRIVTGSFDGTDKLWDATSGQEVQTFRGHIQAIRSVAFSPDGRRIVTGGDKGADVWEAASGRELLMFNGHSDRVLSVAFSPDGRRIVSGSWDKTAKVWDAASGQELFTLKGHDNAIWAVGFSPDGQRIVTGSADGTASVWEAASGRPLLTFKGHSGEIRSVAFSPDGQRIVTGAFDKTAKVWETATGLELLTLKGQTNWIRSVAFSPDGQRIATGGRDNIATIWSTAETNQVAAWQEEERAAAQTLGVRQQARAAERQRLSMVRTRDSIKKWLILAPISLASGQSGAEGLDIEQIKGEGLLRPKAGETAFIAGNDFKWRPVVLKDYLTDFNDILGQVTEHSVAYAVCYLWSETDQRGLQLLVGSDDESKVYLNGKEIYKSLETRIFDVDQQDTVANVTLNAGLNVLVFKVVNEEGGWQGAIRFVDAQGNPVEGTKVTLDPGAKASP
jgi:WD40 repeat protein/serine/threonine protein kinase